MSDEGASLSLSEAIRRPRAAHVCDDKAQIHPSHPTTHLPHAAHPSALAARSRHGMHSAWTRPRSQVRVQSIGRGAMRAPCTAPRFEAAFVATRQSRAHQLARSSVRRQRQRNNTSSGGSAGMGPMGELCQKDTT